jgi:sec-independent protein translocase protein TatA
MFGSLGFAEIALILLIIVVLFGANRVSDLGRGLGEGIRNFKKAVKSDDEQREHREKTDK